MTAALAERLKAAGYVDGGALRLDELPEDSDDSRESEEAMLMAA